MQLIRSSGFGLVEEPNSVRSGGWIVAIDRTRLEMAEDGLGSRVFLPALTRLELPSQIYDSPAASGISTNAPLMLLLVDEYGDRVYSLST